MLSGHAVGRRKTLKDLAAVAAKSERFREGKGSWELPGMNPM